MKPTELRTLLISALGPFLVVFTLNLGMLWYLDHYTPNRGYWLVEQKWQMLKTVSAPVDWLVLGDSSGNQGVVPHRLEDGLGGSALNLCTMGGLAALDDAWLLETYIEQVGPPENVLIVHTYDAWHREIVPVVLAEVPLPWGYWNELSPAVKLTWKDRKHVFLARYVPLYAKNATIVNLLYQGIQSPSSLLDARFHLEPSGFMRTVRAAPRHVDQDAESHNQYVAKNPASISDVNRAAINHITALAEKHHINVLIANGPLYEGIGQSKAFQEHVYHLRQQIQGLTDQSDYVTYMPSLVIFRRRQMQNADHVTYDAAMEYTEFLAAEIAQTQE